MNFGALSATHAGTTRVGGALLEAIEAEAADRGLGEVRLHGLRRDRTSPSIRWEGLRSPHYWICGGPRRRPWRDREVFNDRGEFFGPAEITDNVTPGIVMANVGHWHADNGGTTINSITLDEHCGLGNAGVYSDNLVEVMKVDQAS